MGTVCRTIYLDPELDNNYVMKDEEIYPVTIDELSEKLIIRGKYFKVVFNRTAGTNTDIEYSEPRLLKRMKWPWAE